MPLPRRLRTAPRLPAAAMLSDLDVCEVRLVGGLAALSGEGAVSIVEHDEQDCTVDRRSGPGRLATAATCADNAIERLGSSAELTLLARSDAVTDAPILLAARPDDLVEPTANVGVRETVPPA